MHKIWCVD